MAGDAGALAHSQMSSGESREGIDPAMPAGCRTLRHRRKLELESLPVRIEHQMDQESSLDAPHGAGQAVRMIPPVGLVEFDAVPLNLSAAQKLVQA